MILDPADTRQVVTQTQRHVVGVSAATGALLWRLPLTTPYVQNIVTPVVFEGLVIFSGLSQPTTAVRVVKGGAGWATEPVWENSQVSMSMSSPVLHNGLLFGLSSRNKGQFFCLDARTGAIKWITEGREAENAAVVRAADLLLLLTDAAEIIVARPAASGSSRSSATR